MPDDRLRLATTPFRYFTVSLAPIALVMGVGAVVGWIGAGNGVYEGFLMGGVAVLSAGVGMFLVACARTPRLVIELRESTLSGPSDGWANVVVSMDEVDCERSSRRSRFQRAVGEQIIWLKHGERVIANHRWYQPGELVRLLQRLGIGETIP